MAYTEEEIKKYLSILRNYKVERDCSPGKTPGQPKCRNCPNNEFFTIDYGQKICNECGAANGHVLGLFDVKIWIGCIIKKRVFIIGNTIMRKR